MNQKLVIHYKTKNSGKYRFCANGLKKIYKVLGVNVEV